MLPPDERPKAVLRAVIAYAKARDRWPDIEDLRRFRKNLGGTSSVYRALALLRDKGLIEPVGNTVNRRWIPTAAGFDVARRPAFTPPLERKSHLQDAAFSLAQPNLHNAPRVVRQGAYSPQDASLTIQE